MLQDELGSRLELLVIVALGIEDLPGPVLFHTGEVSNHSLTPLGILGEVFQGTGDRETLEASRVLKYYEAYGIFLRG